jgi:hypothetical protein
VAAVARRGRAARTADAVAERAPDGGPPIHLRDRMFEPGDSGPGNVYMDRRQGFYGNGVNMTEDITGLVNREAFTVIAHGSPGSSTFARRRSGGEISPRAMAETMVEGGYRGGDVVLVSCSAACSPLPVLLRAELDDVLARRGHTGRVDLIAAPSTTVRGNYRVNPDGHWQVFDRDTSPMPAPREPRGAGTWAGVVVVGGSIAGSQAVPERPEAPRRDTGTRYVATGIEG